MKFFRHAMSTLATFVLWLCCTLQAHAASPPWNPAPHIDGVDVEEVAKLSPGTRLVFTVFGSAGGQASLRIEGVDRRLDLTEAQPGVYEGVYTVDARDRLAADSRVTATLRLHGEVASAQLDEPLVLGGQPSVLADAGGNVTESPSAMPEPERAAAPPVASPTPVAQAPTTVATPIAVPCASCGVVESIQRAEAPRRSGAIGAIAGGIIGAILGDQVGRGAERTTARIIGALGGAYAGHEIERNLRDAPHYDVVVRLPGGDRRTVAFSSAPPLKVGDTVSFADGNVRRAR